MHVIISFYHVHSTGMCGTYVFSDAERSQRAASSYYQAGDSTSMIIMGILCKIFTNCILSINFSEVF